MVDFNGQKKKISELENRLIKIIQPEEIEKNE